MVRAVNLSRHYGHNRGIIDLNFHIQKGEILGFLGPNGAGKSTTMNIITGYLSATEGQVFVNGMDVLEQPEEVKKQIGYLPEHPPLYMEMTVTEYLKFIGEIKSVPKKQFKQDMDKIMDLVKIQDVSKRLIGNLSKGYKQRVGLAQALLGNPALLILDEPTVGLDPGQIIEIRNLINNLKEDHTIILSSHILPEVQAVCERVLILSNGRIVASDTPNNLSKRLIGTSSLSIRVKGPEEKIVDALNTISNIEEVEKEQCAEEGTVDILIKAAPDTDIREDVFQKMSDLKTPILQMRPRDLTLEDIFLQLTTNEKEVQ